MVQNNIIQNFELLNHLPIGSCIINEDYVVLFWNNYLENSSKISKSEIVGSKLNDFFPHFSNELYISRLESIFKGGAPVIFSSHLHKFLFNPPTNKNPKRIHRTVVTAIPIPGTKQYYALFSLEDVTELSNKIVQYRELKEEAIQEIERRKIGEQNLLKSEMQLKELNATKDKFFTIIAHDLKNPFNSMLGFLRLLSENFDDYDASTKKELIGYIHESTENTYKLLENLLTWSQSQSGMLNYKPDKENIYILINDTIKILNSLAENKSISIINKVSDKLFVSADKDMLSTIIRNLISNAIKFTPHGGEILLQGSIITNENNISLVKIAVEDNGIGISKEVQSRLFKITENISTQGTEKEPGTGLGLILCYEFIEKLGGKIWIESKEGKGSKFIFTLPMV